MTSPSRELRERPSNPWLLAFVLMLIYLLVRLPGLLALPVFGDEAIYIRWAQLIAQGHGWVSLADPKPPLHFWLLAGMLSLVKDPLLAARLLSVLAGLATVPVLLALGGQLAALARPPRDDGRRFSGSSGLIAAVLLIFSPFLAFYQRFATADALFVLEMLLVLWLGLKLALDTRAGAWRWHTVLALGVALGAALLTRQILSYLLPALIVLGFALLPGRKPVRSFALGLGLACLLALLLWLPYLLAWPASYHVGQDPAAPLTAASMQAELTRRVLYQPNFAPPLTLAQRSAQIAQNFALLFLPARASGEYIRGWFYVYLTPPVYLLGLAGLLWLAVRRHWRLLTYLLGALLLLAGPLVLVGSTLFSRYGLPAATVLLLAAACALAEFLTMLATARRRWLIAVAGPGLILLTFGWGLSEIARQSTRWQHQTLLAQDRYWYTTGWTAGSAAMQALEGLQRTADRGEEMVVLTGAEWGLPADWVWAGLQGRQNVHLFWVDWAGSGPLLRRQADGRYLLRPDKWTYAAARPVALPPGALVYYVCGDPVYTAAGPVPAAEFFRRHNPPPEAAFSLPNPPGPGGKPSDHVAVFILGTVPGK